jgi:hypothetical protein
VPDELLTVDEAAQRLALPPEMIRRRIESGDIPVHWVEVGGKLEMRVASEDVGGLASPAPTVQDPYSPQESYAPAETYSPPETYSAQDSYGPETAYSPPAEDETQPSVEAAVEEPWTAGPEEYPTNLWTPVNDTRTQETNPWDLAPTADDSSADVGPAAGPVWRPDPATWEDEPLDSTPAPAPSPAGEEYAPLPGPYLQSSAEPEREAEPEAAQPAVADFGTSFGGEQPPESAGLFTGQGQQDDEYAAPATSGYGHSSPSPYDRTEEEVAFEAVPTQDEEPVFETVAYEEEIEAEVADASPPPPDALTPPSTLAASQLSGAGSVAINSIDARELVAGLFERWERALEQRIQAEQRLRFEAELEQRLRQVRDLRQELDQTRKTQAAEMAEREREMMELRNRVRELEKAPKGRGLFRR